MRLTTKLAAKTTTLVAVAATTTFLLFSFADANDASAANPCVVAADSAQDLRKEGKLREARGALLVCSRAQCNTVIRADCEKWLKEVDEQMPSLVIRTVDARGRDVLNARVTIDESPIELDGAPVQLDPGQHVLRAKLKSGETIEEKTLVVQGEKGRIIELRFKTEIGGGTAAGSSGAIDSTNHNHDHDQNPPPPPPPPPAPGNVLPIALAGVGIVALGFFTYFEISAQSGYTDLKNGCGSTPQRCPPSKTDPVKQQFTGAAVSLTVSIIALGAATIIYFARKPSTPDPASNSTTKASSHNTPLTILRDGAISF